MSETPAAYAGAVTVIVEFVMAVIVAAVPPNETDVALRKPGPVIVTAVPPAIGPLAGLTETTLGGKIWYVNPIAAIFQANSGIGLDSG
ncbi:MAG TPA: hypothetical protein VGM05_06355, partial [Planctomycetaceae bacterium]